MFTTLHSDWRNGAFYHSDLYQLLFKAAVTELTLSKPLRDVRCIMTSSDGLLGLYLALVGSSYVHPPRRPLLRTTSPGPARAYLVILWPLSLFGWWTDWLLLKIAARADQISQHFVHRGLMKVGGVTNPSSACYDTPVVKVCLSGWWSHCVSFRGTSVATSDNTSQTTSTMCN